MIPIDAHFPIPKGNGRPRIYPFPDMRVGDSFEVEGSSHQISAAARHYSRKTGRKFVTRSGNNRTRCWRVL